MCWSSPSSSPATAVPGVHLFFIFQISVRLDHDSHTNKDFSKSNAALPRASPTSLLVEILSDFTSSCSSFPTLPPWNGAANQLFLLLFLSVSPAHISLPSLLKIPQALVLFSVIFRSLSTLSTSASEIHPFTHFFWDFQFFFSP